MVQRVDHECNAKGKKGLLREKQALGGFLPRACRFDAYPVPYSRVDDRRKAR
jgi:hypothetical protein